MSDSQQSVKDPEVGLLAATLRAYQQSMIDGVFQEPLMEELAPQWNLCRESPTRWEMYRWGIKRRIRRLKALRIVNTEDWHKREDCDGW